MYIANHYVKIQGNLYTPGEVVHGDIDAEKRNRLMEKGAIRLANAPFPQPISMDNANQPYEVEQGNDPFEIDATSSISQTPTKKPTKKGVKK